MTRLLIGLGNPIMGDDAVGIQVVRMLKRKLLQFKELSVGGLRLVEEMLGYDEVIIVDSMDADASQIGMIREFTPDQFKGTEVQALSPHITNFAAAFEFYKKLEPSEMPGKVRIFTIGIRSDLTFREGLSPPIRDATSKLVDVICREIE
jgi:hydrogenase maturation protease